MKIEVHAYNSQWPRLYEAEEKLLERTLGSQMVACFHIGSTAVPGLVAKPIVDILLVVQDVDQLDSYQGSLEDFGYEAMGEFGIPGRRYYRKGKQKRTHQIHGFSFDNFQEIGRHLAFRDYLMAHPETCHEYGKLKRKLAEEYGGDAENYMDGKDAFVKQVERRALRWFWEIY